jgi:hypothetical protein
MVRRRAVVLRRQRLATLTGGLALVAVVLGGGMAAQRGLDAGPRVKVTAAGQAGTPVPPPPGEPEPTTATTATPSSTSSSTLPRRNPTGTSSTTVGRPTTTTAAPVATTTTTEPPVCRNSHDSRCGPFGWDPAPTKGELTVQVLVLTESPQAGKPVPFKVVVDSPDTKIDQGCFDGGYGGNSPYGHCHADYPGCPDEPAAYGPWTPPEKTPDHFEMPTSWTYDQPGTYTVQFTFRTAYPGCRPRGWTDPYADQSSGTVTFTVGPAANGGGSTPTSTSTSTTRPRG